MDNESGEAFEGSTLADELDLAEPTTEPGQRARLFLFPRALRAEAPLRNSQPMFELISWYVCQICGERLGFPDRLRDQENPADLYRSASLALMAFPSTSYSGDASAGFPTACAIRTSRPPLLGSPVPGRAAVACALPVGGMPPSALVFRWTLHRPGRARIAAVRRSGSLGRSPQARPVWGRVRALGLRWTLRHRCSQLS